MYGYFKYKDNIYKGIVGKDFVIEDIYVEIEETSLAGKYVEYDGKLWIVLYDEGEYGEGAQLISADALEVDSVRLAGGDSNINWKDPKVIEEANLVNTYNPSETELLDSREIAIYSYNHAIETLNTKCANLITDKSKIATEGQGNYKIRSVGSNPTSPNSEAGSCPLENLKSWPKNSEIYSAGMFYGIVKNTDENYLTDYGRMQALGICVSENSEEYWLASRLVEEELESIGFKIRTVASEGFLSSSVDFFNIYEDYKDGLMAETGYIEYGVRPVITLKSGILKQAIQSNTTRDGSISNAYIID